MHFLVSRVPRHLPILAEEHGTPAQMLTKVSIKSILTSSSRTYYISVHCHVLLVSAAIVTFTAESTKRLRLEPGARLRFCSTEYLKGYLPLEMEIGIL